MLAQLGLSDGRRLSLSYETLGVEVPFCHPDEFLLNRRALGSYRPPCALATARSNMEVWPIRKVTHDYLLCE